MQIQCTHSNAVKIGFSKGKQRYKCKGCGKTWQQTYKYKAYNKTINHKIVVLTKEGCGIRSISRILKITTNNVLRKIKFIASTLTKPVNSKYKTYKVDALLFPSLLERGKG